MSICTLNGYTMLEIVYCRVSAKTCSYLVLMGNRMNVSRKIGMSWDVT